MNRPKIGGTGILFNFIFEGWKQFAEIFQNIFVVLCVLYVTLFGISKLIAAVYE